MGITDPSSGEIKTQQMFSNDPFHGDEFQPIEPVVQTGSRPTSGKRASSRERVPSGPPAVASKPLKSLCGSMGRLLARIVSECDSGTEDYERVASWFAKWFHSIGIAVRFVKRAPNDYVDMSHYTAFCTRIADNARSSFFLSEEPATELVSRMRAPRNRVTYTRDMSCISDDDAARLADFVQAFLNSSQELFTFERFMAALSQVQTQ